MAIIHRNGPYNLYDKNKLLPFQWAFPNDGTIRCCTSPGVEKIMVTTDDVQELLNTSPEAYSALQSLLEDLEGNPSQLTNILNRLVKLEGSINPQVNSLANLKLITAMTDGSLIFCKGMGLYRYDSSSSALADDFFIIAPNTVPGRWILLAETAMGFSPDTGTANTFILTLPGLAAYYTGMMVWFKATYANTGTCTINVNSLGSKSLVRPGGIGLASGDITAGALICAVYDGTNFQLISLLATNLVHLTATQTLTNKTLTSPTLTTPKMTSGTTINDANGNELVRFPTAVTNAVNEITVNNSAAGIAPSIQASGADTNVGLDFKSKGTGVIRNYINNIISVVFDAVASAVNYLTVKANSTGNAPTISATGTDTNIDVNVVPKGTGRLKENGTVVIRQGDDYRPNILINGDFQLWTAGTSFPYANNITTADKWIATCANDTNVRVLKSGSALRMEGYNTTSASNAISDVSQYIDNYLAFAGKTITVSANVTLDNGVTCALVINDGVSTTNVSPTFSVSGTVQFTFTISSVPAQLKVQVRFFRGGLAVGKGLNVNWVKTEVNDHVSPFIPKLYKEELLNTSDNVGYAPNILINGDFQVWQRGTSFDRSSVIGRFYCADRWCAFRGGYASGLIVSQSTDGIVLTNPNTSYYMELDQSLESGDSKKLRGKTVTVSIKMKSSSSATVYITLSSATSEIIPGSGAGGLVTNVTASVSTSWTTFYCTGVVPADSTGINLTINTSAAVSLTIGYAKLEVNDHATPFIPRSYGEELALCRRYYQVLENTQALPPTARMTTSIYYLPGQVFPVKMRVAPTVSIYSTNYKTLGKITEGNNGNDTGLNVSAHGILESGFTYIKSDAAYVDATVGYSYKYTADAEI